MAAVLRVVKNYARRAPSQPIIFRNINYEVVSAAQKLEEEAFEDFKTGKYYPVRIGNVFASKYQVVGKLGFGVSSTVWLARDLVWVFDVSYCTAHFRGQLIPQDPFNPLGFLTEHCLVLLTEALVWKLESYGSSIAKRRYTLNQSKAVHCLDDYNYAPCGLLMLSQGTSACCSESFYARSSE